MSTSVDDVDPGISEAPPRFKPQYRHRATWIETALSSAIGLWASFVLSLDALLIAANPEEVLSCDINATISCGAVARTWQAELFGFPNAFLGLMAEPVIITVAVASIAGVVFPRWFMIAAQVVSSIGFIFAMWLFYQSYFVILRLCPYCLLITVTTTLIFFAFTRVNILEGNFGESLRRKLDRPLRVYHVELIIAVVFLAILAAMVVFKYL
ncbi:MAG: vitamin K epoxide reductase family protein [Actinobacteria bacterium]|nr:vitamin K epoxide reductase family protein [Actinomycetota bacterium]